MTASPAATAAPRRPKAAPSRDECRWLELSGPGWVCDSGILFAATDDDTLDYAACLTDSCCDEFNACTANGTQAQECIDCLLSIEPTYDRCIAAETCAIERCDQGLIAIQVCDSGAYWPDVAIGRCLGDRCCDEFTACIGNGWSSAVQACVDCLAAGGGELCDAALTCWDTECSVAVCDTGFTVADPALAACLTDNCCDEFTACIGTGSEADVQACLDCYVAGSGPLCDDAIACSTLAECE